MGVSGRKIFIENMTMEGWQGRLEYEETEKERPPD